MQKTALAERRRDIRAYVKQNMESCGRHFSHFYFRCSYDGNIYASATIYPKTAVNLLTNKIFFHTVIKHSPKI